MNVACLVSMFFEPGRKTYPELSCCSFREGLGAGESFECEHEEVFEGRGLVAQKDLGEFREEAMQELDACLCDLGVIAGIYVFVSKTQARMWKDLPLRFCISCDNHWRSVSKISSIPVASF